MTTPNQQPEVSAEAREALTELQQADRDCEYRNFLTNCGEDRALPIIQRAINRATEALRTRCDELSKDREEFADELCEIEMTVRSKENTDSYGLKTTISSAVEDVVKDRDQLREELEAMTGLLKFYGWLTNDESLQNFLHRMSLGLDAGKIIEEWWKAGGVKTDIALGRLQTFIEIHLNLQVESQTRELRAENQALRKDRERKVDPDLLDWLTGKLAEAEKAVRIREGMAATLRSGTDAEWKSAANLHASTAGQISKKADRIKEASRHDSIAEKLRYNLKMLQATAAMAKGEAK